MIIPCRELIPQIANNTMGQQRKKEMRREMRLMLANLDKRWAEVAYNELCAQLVTLVTVQLSVPVQHILCWVPCFPGEVDLAPFITEMLKSERKVYLPRVEQYEGRMSFVQIGEDWGAKLVPGAKGILEPPLGSGEIFKPEYSEDVAVMVPGLAYDRSGKRLGRGGGYYDRLLSIPEMREASKIGICWSMQVVHDTPTDAHDVPMDWICHERGALKVERDL